MSRKKGIWENIFLGAGGAVAVVYAIIPVLWIISLSLIEVSFDIDQNFPP